MTRHALPFFLFVLVIAGGVASPAARAEYSLLNGRWKLASSSTETAQRRAAIETATQELPSFMQSRARERLDERTSPPKKIRIAVAGDRIELTGRGQTIYLQVGGPAVAVESEGRRGSARATLQNGNLVITMEGDNGVRTTTYRPSDDAQRLVLDVQFTAQRLSTPVRYRVTYKRS
jgi:hypothetical protein